MKSYKKNPSHAAYGYFPRSNSQAEMIESCLSTSEWKTAEEITQRINQASKVSLGRVRQHLDWHMNSGRLESHDDDAPARTSPLHLSTSPVRIVKLDSKTNPGVGELAPELVSILLPAFAPCAGFSGPCRDHTQWNPGRGWVPRGFRGATGTIDEVGLVLVCAEPGNAYDDESHEGATPLDKLRSAYTMGNQYLQQPADQFARNLRTILNYAWPTSSFEEQMRKTWLTESVLCSAVTEGARVPRLVERECADRYLRLQLSLFAGARVVALGGKAQARLARVGISFVPARAAAPPGCNRADAPESWRRAVAGLE